MKFLIFIIFFIAAYYFAKYETEIEQSEQIEQEVNEIIADIDDIEKADNIDEAIESVENFNKEAYREFQQMKENAKSPASLKFVELTEKQNTLAARGEVLAKKMQPLINSLTPEVAANPEKLESILVPMCTNLKEYIPIFSEIVQIISAKSDLLNEQPIISNELFNGQHNKMKKLISHFLNSQNRIFEEDKKAYMDLHCDDYLALK